MPDHLRKLILSSDCWKQVNCAYILSAKARFCFKKSSKAKKANEANKGQHSPKLQISLLLSLFNVKSSTNVNTILNKCVFKKVGNFHFHYVNLVKLHFVEFIKYTNRYQGYIGIGSFICLYITWKK